MATSAVMLGNNPTGIAAVPGDGNWFDDDEFLRDDRLTEIGKALIEAWPEFHFLRDAHIEFRWKRKGGKSGGKDVYGKCAKATGPLRHFAQCDFLIWIGADHVRESMFTNRQLEALVYHELKHCSFKIDEKDDSPTYGEVTFVVRGHDDELFADELRRYGAWNIAHEQIAGAFEQLPLLAG